MKERYHRMDIQQGQRICRQFLSCCMSAFLLFMLHANSNAQPMHLNLAVPSRTILREVRSMWSEQDSMAADKLMNLSGKALLAILGSENMQVTAEVAGINTTTDPGDSTPYAVSLFYVNDGSSNAGHAVFVPGDIACFPLNDSGLLTGDRPGPPAMLQAFVVIKIFSGNRVPGEPAVRCLNVTLEYN